MKSKVVYLMTSITLAQGLASCSSDTNSQQQAAVPAEFDNLIECQYLRFPDRNCKPSSPDPQVQSPEYTPNPELYSSIPTPKLSALDVPSTSLRNSKGTILLSKHLPSNAASTTQIAANFSPPTVTRRSFSNSTQFANRRKVETTNVVPQFSNRNNSGRNSNSRLVTDLNNNQETSQLVTNEPVVELSQPSVTTEANINQFQRPLSSNNATAEASTNQTQEVGRSPERPLSTNQLNSELITNDVQGQRNSYTPTPEFSNNQINPGLTPNRLPVPFTSSNYPSNSPKIVPSLSNNSQTSLTNSSDFDSSANQSNPQLNPNQLQSQVNLPTNQLNPSININQIQQQFPPNESQLNLTENQFNLQSQLPAPNGIIQLADNRLGLTTRQVSEQLPQTPQTSELSSKSNLKNLGQQIYDLQPEFAITSKPEFAINSLKTPNYLNKFKFQYSLDRR